MRTRFDKLDFLINNCNESFVKECILLTELVGYMSDSDFSDFFDKVCREWDIRIGLYWDSAEETE
jgi:hypothetical protein